MAGIPSPPFAYNGPQRSSDEEKEKAGDREGDFFLVKHLVLVNELFEEHRVFTCQHLHFLYRIGHVAATAIIFERSSRVKLLITEEARISCSYVPWDC